ncbi:uncharacterized protein LOC111403088 isoform X2 [Olea europaea var. sylvestris]|uniref:Uncharacterized protein n=1 Tax=Olea europaea subsp. europaea TaxID=158383 RepID=A0A8S0TUE9_OLEEU|nr:uncharacterized protein LOC111403088 isoform X2 [Olea europaea var. sylvestris]CAA3009589.1 Hypothetical predicted protein [Olea europaea subsp. europaea]
MGEALFDLERILRSRQEKLTSQEANILLACKAQAMRDFTIGFGGGSVTTWLATQRLSNLVRFNFTLGVAAISGLWKFGRSLDSSIEHILSLEGSRMQMELANVMLKKYHSDPWVIERLSRHFYSEEVYDDSSADQPKVRWRFRNYFGDNVAHPQTTSNNEDTDLEKNNLKKTSREAPKNYRRFLTLTRPAHYPEDRDASRNDLTAGIGSIIQRFQMFDFVNLLTMFILTCKLLLIKTAY